MKTMSMSCREDCHEVAQGILTFCLVWLAFWVVLHFFLVSRYRVIHDLWRDRCNRSGRAAPTPCRAQRHRRNRLGNCQAERSPDRGTLGNI
jgi:hypothetical protein